MWPYVKLLWPLVISSSSSFSKHVVVVAVAVVVMMMMFLFLLVLSFTMAFMNTNNVVKILLKYDLSI